MVLRFFNCINAGNSMQSDVCSCFFPAVGYSLVAINGQPVTNRCTSDGTSALKVLNDSENYPISLKFARLRVSINERIMLLSMFHS